MGCECKNQIELYLDDELPASERRSVELHLASCPSCKSIADEFQAVASLVQQSSEMIPVREEWLQHVSSEIANHTVQRPSVHSAKFYKVVACLAAIAATIVVVLSVNVYRPNGESTPPDPQVAKNIVPVAPPSDRVTSSPNATDRPTVIANDGFLAARDPQSDESFEFYWVLPQQTNF